MSLSPLPTNRNSFDTKNSINNQSTNNNHVSTDSYSKNTAVAGEKPTRMLTDDQAATKIQSFYRGYATRKDYKKVFILFLKNCHKIDKLKKKLFSSNSKRCSQFYKNKNTSLSLMDYY